MRHSSIDVIGAAMRNRNIVFSIAFLLMAAGVIALIKMPRNEYPQFTIRQGVVVGVYPGATSAEVEAQLTRVVENYVFQYQEVNKEKTYSYSREGVMYLFVELNGKVKNADQFWSKLKHGLDELKMTLPPGVLALVANSDFGDTSALLITLSSDTKSYKDLEQELKKMEAEFRKIPETSKIKHFGLQKDKIYVSVRPELLNEYNINTLSLFGSYQLNGMVNYAGVLKDKKQDLAVHLPASFASEKDLAEQIVYSDPAGNVVRLKDIASIERRKEDPDSYITQSGKKTILVSLEMQPGNNIVEYGAKVDKALESFGKTCPHDITVSKISELPKYVDDSITNFMKEFLIAIVAVILVTMLLLPFRISSVAGITVPIAVLITLAILYFFGVELHTVSLASLIVVLGMIVDNSIVIIDNHVELIDRGGSSWHAAIKSAKELFIPIVTATLAIFAAYFPLNIFVTGTTKEFLYTIPIVVGTALLVSVLVATLVVPYMNFMFIKKGLKHTEEKRKTFLDLLQGWFDSSLEKAFRHPKIVLSVLALLLGFSVILFLSTDKKLFPEVERNQFAVEIYLPSGYSLNSTAEVVDSVAGILKKDPRVTNITSFIGTSSPRFHTVYAPNMPAPNFGQLLVNTTSNEATQGLVRDYDKKLSGHFADAVVYMRILALQPNKSPIEIRISSDSVKDIRKVEGQVSKILDNTKSVKWIHNDWNQQEQGVKVNIDMDRANRMGYTRSLISSSLMVGLEGVPLTTLWEGDYPVQVVLKQESPHEGRIQKLEDQYVTSPMSFKAVPLRSMATFGPDWNEGTVAHRNGVRTLTIQVECDRSVMPSKIFDELRPEVDKLELPQGTSINYGGEYEGQVEVFNPMVIALCLSILIIFFILFFQFKKASLALLILSTMVLTFPGAAIGLKLMGYPFSVTGFLGITSLCGLVVRNGIILIDYLLKLRKTQNLSAYEAALAAGKRRMRPIFLTSAAAAVGVIPMILSKSLLWGPLGSVICFGLLIAMVLTLYVLPLLYWLLFRNTDKANNKRRRSYHLKPELIMLLLGLLTAPSIHAQKTYTLDESKRLSLENNKLLKNGQLEIDASQQVKKAAFTKYFPNLSATGMSVKFNDPLMEISVPGGNLPVYNGDPATLPFATEFAYFPGMNLSMLDKLNTGAVTLTQPLFTGGRIYYGNQLAKKGVEAGTHLLELSSDEVLFKTEELYWQIVSLNEKVKTLEAYSKLLDTLYRDVSNAKKAGLINNNDVLKVSLKQNELEMNSLKLDNGLKLAKMAFCQQIGVNYDPNIQLADSSSVYPQPQSLQTSHDKALKERAEYRLLEDKVEVEKLQSKIKRGGYLPEIALGAGAFTFNMEGDDWKNRTMVFGTLNIPISAYWEASHSLKERKIREQIARNQADNTGELLLLQMQQSWNELDEAYQQIALAGKSLEQSKENLRITKTNYDSGIIGISDLLEAQAMVQDANDRLTEACCTYKLKIAKYQKATGRYQ